MKVMNSSTGKLVELNDQKITIYNCGPTVYNHVHIGNVRPLVVFDVLHRYLLRIRKEVAYIQNITDVDDKIIKTAKEANLTEKQLADKYTEAYLSLFDTLNIKAVFMPRVSEYIRDIQRYILALVEKGAAYVVDGDVYFDISKSKDYGHVSRQNIEALLDGVRKENKSNKKNPLDFALWKKTSEGINWDSPWSNGRPGWHTECCVLINKFAGKKVTIHGGGVDLKFPHHENENAQNLAMCGCDIADIWMHVGHVNVDGAKMSKSLNNFVFVKDVVNQKNANGLRWFFYKAKYEQPINFTNELLDEADKEIKNILHNFNIARTHTVANDAFVKGQADISKNFSTALSDDLNLPNAITEINEQIKQLNSLLRDKNFYETNKLWNVIAKEFEVLGIRYETADLQEHLPTILNWKKALDNKDFKTADELREKLVAVGLL